MGNIAIHTENLGKRYRLGATVDLTRTFREAIIEFPKKFMTTAKRKAWQIKQAMLDSGYDPKSPPGTFWALRNINIDINHGEVVGIIGRNGAGKSTLLKILSRITSPTEGMAKINGRVGSLLEVGTGFHPELTGRENIYLNGSILGMTKAEIDKKFDEIVAFAEVEQFLETPIKRFSSGMQVRLAFAVAAHLEPEILIVDEVLAVGDAAFQKKCLGKMEDVSKEGRTVLFVSHNLAAIKKLCERCFLLKSGKIETEGNTNNVVNYYLENISSGLYGSLNNPVIRKEDTNNKEKPYVKEVSITDKNGNIANTFSSTEEIHVNLKIEPNTKLNGNINAIWHLYDSNGDKLARGPSYPMQGIGYNTNCENLKFILYPEALVPGDYSLGFQLLVIKYKTTDIWEYAVNFKISENDYYKSGFNYPGTRNELIFVRSDWEKE
jgi:lipopolysaccharide transport system ATP-binding protein